MSVHFPDVQQGQEPPIYEFKRLADQIYEASNNIFDHIIVAKKMRLPKYVEVIDNNYNYFLAIIDRFNLARGTKDKIESYEAMLCPRESREAHDLMMCQMGKPPKIVMDRRTRRPSHRFFRLKVLPMEIVKVYDSRVPRMGKMVSF
jgi:hypothetical protein